MSVKHANISIFVPHIGCPNMCSFCNQRHITGSCKAPTASDVDKAVAEAQKSKNYNPKTTEIAFFGGSFTAINRNYMLRLLRRAGRYVDEGVVSGIRISTRPDAINKEVLEILKQYHVTAIELGAQSMNDTVLRKNNRGHTARDVKNASKLIKEYGFSLGLQMMTGLYGDTDLNAIKTAESIAALRPDTVRIYPTIVLKDTDLAAMYIEKIYTPQSLENAVNLAAKLLLIFDRENISVIRLGLHSIENEAYIAGPWHPAFSELCQSAIYLEKIKEALKGKGNYIIYVKKGAISKATGQKRKNLEALKKLGYNCKIMTDDTLKGYDIIVREEE